MLADDMRDAGVRLELSTEILEISRNDMGFEIRTSLGTWQTRGLVVATGGKSIPKMGATGLGYEIAMQFGHKVTETRAGLVPFTWASHMAESWGALSGVSLDVRARCNGATFREAMLFTHRGLSGPAMLQISSYWRDGDRISIDLAPDRDLAGALKLERSSRPKGSPWTTLGDILPKRLAQHMESETAIGAVRLADMSNAAIETVATKLHGFELTPEAPRDTGQPRSPLAAWTQTS
jgi:predicted Rossmann fold flavoprotein